MKKRHIAICLLACLLCAAFLSSCAPQGGPGGEVQPTKAPNYLSDPKFDTAEALPQYDHDNTWTHLLGESNSCATEDTLYFSGIEGRYSYIFYCDLSTGISGPLCGKPECPHSGGSCNAATFGSRAAGLSIYDGKLYWVDFNGMDTAYVYSMDLDGTDRAEVCSFAASLYQKVYGGTIAFHRGYAIFSKAKMAVTGGAARYSICSFAASLSTGEVTEILDRDVDEGIAPNVTAIPYRDTVYLIYWETAEDQVRLEISTWSLKTHETALLYSQKVDFFPREVWPTEDGLLFSPFINNKIYKFDPLENTVGPLFDFSSEEERNYMPEFANDYLIGWILTEEQIPHLRVTDLEGNAVYEEDLDLPDWPTQGGGYALMGADDGNVYARLEFSKKDEALKTRLVTTLVQIPLDGGGTVRELWSLEQELG